MSSRLVREVCHTATLLDNCMHCISTDLPHEGDCSAILQHILPCWHMSNGIPCHHSQAQVAQVLELLHAIQTSGLWLSLVLLTLLSGPDSCQRKDRIFWRRSVHETLQLTPEMLLNEMNLRILPVNQCDLRPCSLQADHLHQLMTSPMRLAVLMLASSYFRFFCRVDSGFVILFSFSGGVRLKITSRIRLELSKQKMSTCFWISEDRSKVSNVSEGQIAVSKLTNVDEDVTELTLLLLFPWAAPHTALYPTLLSSTESEG
mmetsp:Transcript_45906/g.96145  ORF Transcript_45906/g.96145 Transcript_45906/m.96145 type:complete len:260 (-) Transcript_45906:318-1097(-)